MIVSISVFFILIDFSILKPDCSIPLSVKSDFILSYLGTDTKYYHIISFLSYLKRICKYPPPSAVNFLQPFPVPFIKSSLFANILRKLPVP